MDRQKPYVLFPISDWDIASHALGVLLRLFLASHCFASCQFNINIQFWSPHVALNKSIHVFNSYIDLMKLL